MVAGDFWSTLAIVGAWNTIPTEDISTFFHRHELVE